MSKKLFTVSLILFSVFFLAEKSSAQINAGFMVSGMNTVCLGNAVAFIDQSTGGPVSWVWSFPGATPSTSNQQNPVVQYVTPGTWDVSLIVTDGGGNSDTLTMLSYIFVDFNILTEMHTDCICGLSNGTITIAASGMAPFTYNWSNGSNTQNQTGLSPGFYSVTVFDAIGCMAMQSITLQAVSGLGVLESHTDATCGNSDGAIDLTIQNGTPPFVFLWNTGATTEDLLNIVSGIYSVTVTDSIGCGLNMNIPIANINGPSVITSFYSSASCGNANGQLDVNVTGGVPAYTYAWSNGATTEDLTNIDSGTYVLTVTDQNLCPGYYSFTMADSNVIALNAVMSNTSCANNGSITLNVTGGIPPYTYAWSNGATTSSINNVPPGVYSVTVNETSGCSFSQTFNATFYSYVFITGTVPNCTNNGALTATPYGSNPPYNYLWSNGGTDQTITSLAPGNYSVTVTDNAGCISSGNHSLPTLCMNVIEGNVFNDINANCIQDSGEMAIQNIYVTATSGTSNYYGFTNSDGEYQILIGASGSYTLSATNNNLVCGTLNVCTATGVVNFPSVGDTSSENNFGFNSGSATFDLRMHPGWSTANPGFDKHYWILYYNAAPIAFTDTATVVFTYDANLIYFDSIAPFPVHDNVAHTLTWDVTNVPNPNWNWPDRLHAFFHVPATLPIGTYVQSDFDISPTIDDCNPANNHLHYNEPVTGSLDPNSKEVLIVGDIQDENSTIIYTINFQNTGTDTTNFVILTDTLSEYLDPTTVVNLASSHPYELFDVSGTGILKWIFNPILLVDSATNEQESKGFVKFSIKRDTGLAYGTVITNTASIFFDYNSPVITNTVETHLIWFSVSDVSENISVSSFPNPFSESTTIQVNGLKENFDFTLNNVLGMKMTEQKNISENKFSFSKKDLPAGIYFFTISVEGKNVANGKLIIE